MSTVPQELADPFLLLSISEFRFCTLCGNFKSISILLLQRSLSSGNSSSVLSDYSCNWLSDFHWYPYLVCLFPFYPDTYSYFFLIKVIMMLILLYNSFKLLFFCSISTPTCRRLIWGTLFCCFIIHCKC